MHNSTFISLPNSLAKGVLVALVFVIAGCTSSPSLKSVTRQNPTLDIASYTSFAWIAENPLVGKRGLLSDRNKKRLEDGIKARLVAKGYDFVDSTEDADFVVSYTRGDRRSLTKGSYPETYRAGWQWNQPTYADERDMRSDRVSYSSSKESSVYVESSLAVDIFDVDAGELAWQGSAYKEMTRSERKDPAEFLIGVIDQIFKSFPDRK